MRNKEFVVSLSNNHENYVLNELFRNTHNSAFASVDIVQLATGVVDDTTNLYTNVETPPPAYGYSNQSYAAGSTNWKIQASGVGYSAHNKSAIQFGPATGPWGTVTQFAISDTDEDGKMIAYGTLTEPKTVTAGDVVIFSSGSLKFTIV